MLLAQAAELAALVSRVTTSEKEAQEQRKEVTALKKELDISQTQLQLTKNKLDEIERTIAGILTRNTYLHRLHTKVNRGVQKKSIQQYIVIFIFRIYYIDFQL